MNTTAYTPMHIQDLINRTAMEANILPLTSRCDSACIFCSHQNNPPQVQVLSVDAAKKRIALTMKINREA